MYSKTPVFTNTSKPVGVGTLLRHTGCGNRIYVVTKRSGNLINFVYYGNTNKGNFKPAQRAGKVHNGVINKVGLIYVAGNYWRYQPVKHT